MNRNEKIEVMDGSVTNKHNPSNKLSMRTCISLVLQITTAIHVKILSKTTTV